MSATGRAEVPGAFYRAFAEDESVALVRHARRPESRRRVDTGRLFGDFLRLLAFAVGRARLGRWIGGVMEPWRGTGG